MKKYEKLFFLVCINFMLILLVSCGKEKNITEYNNKGAINSNESIEEVLNDAQEAIKYEVKEELSDDIRSFQVQINDNLYTFPIAYNDFINTGWKVNELYDSVDGQIESKCDDIVRFYNGDIQIDCYIYNPDISKQSYERCVIAGAILDSRFEAKGATIYVPGGFRLGAASRNDVINVLGEPDAELVFDDYKNYEYKTDNVWTIIDLKFDENDVLIYYNVENPIVPSDYIFSESKESNVIYEIPEKIGNSLEDRIINFAGDLYYLPAPVSAFINNGWEVERKDEIVPAGRPEWIELQRDNCVISLSIRNLSEYACTVENCFVKCLRMTDVDEFALTEDISMDITIEQLEKILKEDKYAYDMKSTDLFITYNIKLSGVSWDDYCNIAFNTKDKSLAYITYSTSAPEER